MNRQPLALRTDARLIDIDKLPGSLLFKRLTVLTMGHPDRDWIVVVCVPTLIASIVGIELLPDIWFLAAAGVGAAASAVLAAARPDRSRIQRLILWLVASNQRLWSERNIGPAPAKRSDASRWLAANAQTAPADFVSVALLVLGDVGAARGVIAHATPVTDQDRADLAHARFQIEFLTRVSDDMTDWERAVATLSGDSRDHARLHGVEMALYQAALTMQAGSDWKAVLEDAARRYGPFELPWTRAIRPWLFYVRNVGLVILVAAAAHFTTELLDAFIRART